MAAISFPQLPGPPVVPGPPSVAERDESSPTPPVGVPLRDRLLGAGVLLVLFAILAATAGWRVLRDDSATVTASGPEQSADPTGPSSTAPSADQWPAAVLPLVAFVEQHRGGDFDHPVPITYLTQEEYQAEVESESQDLTEEDEADLEAWEGQMRALGLIESSTDVLDATEEMYGGGTLAFYDPEANEVKVLGTELDVAHEVTLVHELTHAWQDQHGYLDQLEELDDPEAYTLQAIAEGDAMRIENEYIDSLSSRELDDYFSQSDDQSGDVDLSGVPDALIASFSSLYSLGGPFVGVLDDEGGNAEIDAALGDPPPAEADVVVPGRYFDDLEPVEVAEPSVPAGAERLDGGAFGAVSWLITLSERIDPREVLDVVDTWAGDQYVVYRQDGRICTAAAYRGLTPADTAGAASQMTSWAAAMDGHGASAEQVGDDVVLRSCEADGDRPVVGRSQLAVAYAALRLEAMAEALYNGATETEAACFGNAIVDALTPEQMEAGAAYDPDEAARIGEAASEACLD